jgi:threonine/homoserine/homoserine lactone efflux protein
MPRMDALTLAPAGPLWLYFVLVLGIIALPGMDMAYVLGSALTDGPRGGAAALAGIVAGGMAHMAMASLGVGWVLQSVPALFNAMLLAGALYLGWIGVSLLRSAAALREVPTCTPTAWHITFWRGMATCLLNPKAYLFMVAVFPQFVRAEQGSVVAQALALGAITAATQVAVYGAVALAATRTKALLRGSAAAQRGWCRGVGCVLLLGAAWMLWQGWQTGG